MTVNWLVSYKDANSWQSLLEAARIRNDRPVLDIEDTLQENKIPNIPMKRALVKIKEGITRWGR